MTTPMVLAQDAKVGMGRIAIGTFTMGSLNWYPEEAPSRRVRDTTWSA